MPPSIYSNCSVVFYCCICQRDGSISGLAFHEQHPNSSLCPSAPPSLNILYAHLRGSSTSYCLRGYYNDKFTHCAEKGGKEMVILTVFSPFVLNSNELFCIFPAPATYRLPSQFQQSAADHHLKLSWKRLDWRGGVKSWVFCLIRMLPSHCRNTIQIISCQRFTQALPNAAHLASQ